MSLRAAMYFVTICARIFPYKKIYIFSLKISEKFVLIFGILVNINFKAFSISTKNVMFTCSLETGLKK